MKRFPQAVFALSILTATALASDASAQEQEQEQEQEREQVASASEERGREAVLAESLEEATATVIDVQQDTRLVTLRTDDGREFTLEAGEEVRNFDQIGIGDRVSATFYEALAAEVTDAPPGAEPTVLATRRAPLGGRPSGAVGLVSTAVVTIDAVDPETDTVTFTGPRGQREVTVLMPELQEFVETLKPGDRVEVTYGEALAVELTPAD